LSHDRFQNSRNILAAVLIRRRKGLLLEPLMVDTVMAMPAIIRVDCGCASTLSTAFSAEKADSESP